MKFYRYGLGVSLTLALLAAARPNGLAPALQGVVDAQSQTSGRNAARDALITRAKSFELNTPYVPPPGDPLEHDAAGFAKTMCSAVFITGLDLDFASQNVGGFTAPFDQRAQFGKPVVDRVNKTVTVTLPNGVRRIAKYLGDQGCVTLPTGTDSLNFKPISVKSRLGDPSKQRWPMGDVLPKSPLRPEINAIKLKQAI